MPGASVSARTSDSVRTRRILAGATKYPNTRSPGGTRIVVVPLIRTIVNTPRRATRSPRQGGAVFPAATSVISSSSYLHVSSGDPGIYRMRRFPCTAKPEDRGRRFSFGRGSRTGSVPSATGRSVRCASPAAAANNEISTRFAEGFARRSLQFPAAKYRLRIRRTFR